MWVQFLRTPETEGSVVNFLEYSTKLKKLLSPPVDEQREVDAHSLDTDQQLLPTAVND